jgi:hypothetical protein
LAKISLLNDQNRGVQRLSFTQYYVSTVRVHNAGGKISHVIIHLMEADIRNAHKNDWNSNELDAYNIIITEQEQSDPLDSTYPQSKHFPAVTQPESAEPNLYASLPNISLS